MKNNLNRCLKVTGYSMNVISKKTGIQVKKLKHYLKSSGKLPTANNKKILDLIREKNKELK